DDEEPEALLELAENLAYVGWLAESEVFDDISTSELSEEYWGRAKDVAERIDGSFSEYVEKIFEE
ncbi:MAG: hypothetical protein SXQ77_07340, partial [Halobacteria archaeon]|nr:hypothetical protein [Halobacteria archaeon]